MNPDPDGDYEAVDDMSRPLPLPPPLSHSGELHVTTRDRARGETWLVTVSLQYDCYTESINSASRYALVAVSHSTLLSELLSAIKRKSLPQEPGAIISSRPPLPPLAKKVRIQINDNGAMEQI